MTTEQKHRSGWLVACGGIPLTIFITWIFLAGGMQRDLQATMVSSREAEKLNQAQEIRLTRLELNIERQQADTVEIKTDLKEIKRMLKGQ